MSGSFQKASVRFSKCMKIIKEPSRCQLRWSLREDPSILLDIRFHVVKEAVANKEIKIEYVVTQE